MKYLILLGILLCINTSIYSQIDANSVMGLPTVTNTTEMQGITGANTGSIVYNIAEEEIFMFNGITWISCNLSNTGLQFYTWNTGNVSQPNINNKRGLGVSTTQGRTTADLNNTLRGNLAPDNDGYIIAFIGTIRVQNTGNFTFTSRSDDGSRIYIDDVVALNNWFNQAPTTRTATVNLAAGEHKIEFWYYENAGGDFMEFTWGANPDGYTSGSVINANQFFVK
ncbi:PA14 domain-containing protein [Tenacibaculum amylolyticum]|uniref:PA14 domain-containing protein n=1 Tax=Tenacibaculum amylolyticum TaxID=104269 RepID=UPI0038967FC8